MTAQCQHCKRPENDLYLCQSCQTQLANALDQIPWLLDELDNRIQKLDRTNTGTIGRNRRPDELNPVDFDAIELSREIRALLLRWVETVAQRHTGRRIPALSTATTKNLARWLHANTGAIARLNCAGKLYNDITHIAGTPDRPGRLHRAINPTEHHLVGPCPTILGRHPNGTPRQCGRNLFADTYDHTVDCPDCGQTIDVETTRLQAAAERDLHTRNELIDILTTIDEPIHPARLRQWITTGRLRPKGYRHNNAVTEYRIHPDAEPVYSLDRTRRLLRRDNHLTGATKGS